MSLENPHERGPELFPARERVLEIIIADSAGLKLEVLREMADEDGVYFLEIRTTELDVEGYIREYTYSRKSLRTDLALIPKVHVAFLSDDIPVGGVDIFTFR